MVREVIAPLLASGLVAAVLVTLRAPAGCCLAEYGSKQGTGPANAQTSQGNVQIGLRDALSGRHAGCLSRLADTHR